MSVMYNYVFRVAEIHAYRAEHTATNSQYTAAQKNNRPPPEKYQPRHQKK